MADWLISFSGDVCHCQNGATTLHLALVKRLEQSEFIPAAKTLAWLTPTAAAEREEWHIWEKLVFCHRICPCAREELCYSGGVAKLGPLPAVLRLLQTSA